MSIKVQSSFSAGELDPALHERTTLDKYRSALATARNVVIGKTGRVVSAPGRKWFAETKTSGRRIKIHTIPEHGVFLEWGHLYVRKYNLYTGTLDAEGAHTYTEAQLDDISFLTLATTGDDEFDFTVLILGTGLGDLITFDAGTNTLAVPGSPTYASSFYVLPSSPISTGNVTTAGGATGYGVRYAVSRVVDGEESWVTVLGPTSTPIPLVVGDLNTIGIDLEADAGNVTEMRVYRKPVTAQTTFTSGWGFIGLGDVNVATGLGEFIDYGVSADYGNPPPGRMPGSNGTIYNPTYLEHQTATVYQQRLILTDGVNIHASRTGYFNNFAEDYPLDADVPLQFRSANGEAKVIHVVENDGLIMFTDKGILLHRGELTPTNLSLSKKGAWIADAKVPPVTIPGATLFIDKSTNAVRQFLQNDTNIYVAEEVSIFSDHLFSGNKVRSWDFQDGELPLLYVTFTNGTMATFTYEREHKMKAWTRHDFTNDVEWVSTMSGIIDFDPQTIFVTKNADGTRQIELAVPRYLTSDIASTNPESDKNESMAAMTAMVSWENLLNDFLTGSDVFTFVPQTDWEGLLDLSCGTSGVFVTGAGNAGNVGAILRHFDADGAAVDLEVISRTDDNNIVVQPVSLFPSSYSATARLYLTKTVFTGLDHMEGENVGVIADGYLLASPNNDVDNYTIVTVSGGSITLPNSYSGAIVHIGRPYVMDVETLDVDTVEQSRSLIESMTVNKLYIRVLNSFGFRMSSRFPKTDGLTLPDNDEMEEIFTGVFVDYEDTPEVTANRYTPAYSGRIELTLRGDWRSQGRICLRQVDPLHFEILSIIPDLEIQKRSNRKGDE